MVLVRLLRRALVPLSPPPTAHNKEKGAANAAEAAAPAMPDQSDNNLVYDVAKFFANAKRPLVAPVRGNATAALLEAEIAATLAAPLDFLDQDNLQGGVAAQGLADVFGPTLSGPRCNPAVTPPFIIVH